eukprot:5130287-Pleurochrysis_carterae.AAC.1
MSDAFLHHRRFRPLPFRSVAIDLRSDCAAHAPCAHPPPLRDVRRRKKAILTGLLRASRGTEAKWLMRTFLPHMAVGISLEASVLPSVAAAFTVHAHQHAARCAAEEDGRKE